jgi:parvulin-like peptidyl-prolyl isomerase
MASSTRSPLSSEQEAEAQALALRLRELAADELLQMARLLVSKPDREIFGDTEFQLRDIVLRVGAKALEERLRQKKTATMAPV